MTEAAPSSPGPESRPGALQLLSDDRLARRAAEGDQRAFEAIYSRYHQDLYRFCLAMVGNPQDAQDALQNTMVKALRALPGEKREIQLKPWLYRIARNESVETLRKRRDNVELEPQQAVAAGVTETAETRERLRTLLADLEQLPERQRAALVMRELSGLDFTQIGAAFGTSAAVARQTLYEARLSLRQLEAGREMRCTDVMRELSDADGRITRRREIRAHLRSCADCRAFRDEIAQRHDELAALGPLPLAASAGLLHSLLGSGSSAAANAGAGGAGAAAGATGGGAGLGGAVGAGAGKAVATSAIVKTAATVAVAAVVGVSAADRGGLIDVPLPGEGGHASTQSEVDSPGSGSGANGIGKAGAASPGSGAAEHPPGGAGGKVQGEEGSRGSNDGGPKANDDAARGGGSSKSQAGQSPPGGGYGRSASERRGRPEQLPEAAGHGQQTAAAHKPSHAASSPGQSASGGGHGTSSGSAGSPASKPAPKAQAPAAAPPAPEAPPPAPPQAKGGASPPASNDAPPGLER